MDQDQGLYPHEYQIVIAPCFKVATDLAASRNDPTLFNDMASMIALRVLVGHVAELYLARTEGIGQHSAKSVFDAAPDAACAVVLEAYDLEDEHRKSMLGALQHAQSMLEEAGALGEERKMVEMAIGDLIDDRYDRGMNALTNAGLSVVNAVDQWEGAPSRMN